VKLWDLSGEQPKELFTLSPEVADATSLAFSDNAKTLAVGASNAVQFWDVSNKEPSKLFAEASAMIFAPDQDSWVKVEEKGVTRLVSDSLSTPFATIWPWDSFGNATANPDVAHPGDRNVPVALANGGNLLATRQGGVFRLWDLSSDKPKLQATLSSVGKGAAAFSPDGKTIATSSFIGIVEWWSVDKDQSHPLRAHVTPGDVQAMAFSPDGKILAVGGGGSSESESGLVMLWDTQTHERLKLDIRGHRGVGVDVTSLAFSPTDSRILAVGGSDKTVELWDVSTAKLLTPPLEGHKFPVTSVAYSPDGKTIASGDSGGIVNLWNASTFQWMMQLKVSSNEIKSIGFTADGNNLFTNDVKGEIREWSAVPREQVAAQRK